MKNRLFFSLFLIIVIIFSIRGYFWYNTNFYPDLNKYSSTPPDIKGFNLVSQKYNSVDSNLVFRYKKDIVHGLLKKSAFKNMDFEFMISRRIDPVDCFINHGFKLISLKNDDNMYTLKVSMGKDIYLCRAWEFEAFTGKITKIGPVKPLSSEINACKSSTNRRFYRIIDNIINPLRGKKVYLMARVLVKAGNANTGNANTGIAEAVLDKQSDQLFLTELDRITAAFVTYINLISPAGQNEKQRISADSS